MDIKDFSDFPVISLVLYFNRAIDDKHWLEAIVLAQMYIETQLRTLLGKDIRKNKDNISIYALADAALKNNKIDGDLYGRIKEFNSVRNTAVHHLSLGNITYDGLEQSAKQAGSLINELQALCTYKMYPRQDIIN